MIILLYIQYNDVSFVCKESHVAKTLIIDEPPKLRRGANEPLGTTCQGVTGAAATGASKVLGKLLPTFLYLLVTPKCWWFVGDFSPRTCPKHSGLGMISNFAQLMLARWLQKVGETNRVQKCLEKWVQCWNGCFLKWWYPTTIGFPTKWSFWGCFGGYHHLRKHPNGNESQNQSFGSFFCWLHTHTHILKYPNLNLKEFFCKRAA